MFIPVTILFDLKKQYNETSLSSVREGKRCCYSIGGSWHVQMVFDPEPAEMCNMTASLKFYKKLMRNNKKKPPQKM